MSAGPDGGRLFVSDIDGTLVTPDKLLTPAALAAVAAVHAAGIPFSVVSSRPARGMAKVVQALGVSLHSRLSTAAMWSIRRAVLSRPTGWLARPPYPRCG
ncbi:MAG: HAD hydrolase family protein [Caulobacteraceae bacterium]